MVDKYKMILKEIELEDFVEEIIQNDFERN